MIIKDATLPDIGGLEFRESNHTYWLGRTQLPSVTTIMKPLSDAFYGGVYREVLNRAADKGTTVHQSLENFICFGIEDVPPDYKGYLEAYKAFCSEYNPLPIATETRIYHKYLMYAGTGDFLCLIGDALVLIDFKSTSQLVKMLTRVQLEAYDRAFDSHGLKIDKKAILQLKNDGTFKLEWHQKNDTEAWTVFGSLLTVSQYIAKNK